MMRSMPAAPAVCSWSLRPRDADHLAGLVRECGLASVQLALDPIRTGAMPLTDVRTAFSGHGIAIVSGMMAMAGEDYTTLESIRRTGGIVPDATWPQNLAAARENARIAAALGIPLVTFHAGFIPHGELDPLRAALLERLAALRDVFAGQGVRIALETGQEHAATLADLLGELPGVDSNFDPANLILYGMDEPVSALRRLLPRVAQVHVKDAIRAREPGRWGAETVVGAGDVDWAAFLAVLRAAGRPIGLVIEREAGKTRVADIRRAVALLQEHGA